jgi:hypothetical protein
MRRYLMLAPGAPQNGSVACCVVHLDTLKDSEKTKKKQGYAPSKGGMKCMKSSYSKIETTVYINSEECIEKK